MDSENAARVLAAMRGRSPQGALCEAPRKKRKVDDDRSALSPKQAELEATENALEEASQRLSAKQAELEATESALVEASQRLSAKQAELAVKESARLEEASRQLSTARFTREKELSNLRTSWNYMRNIYDPMRAQLATREVEIASLRNENASLRCSFEACHKNLASRTVENQHMMEMMRRISAPSC